MSLAPGGPRHRTDSVMIDTADIVRELNDLLTPRIVAGMAGKKDPGQARKWANGSLAVPPPEQERLRFAYDLLKQIESAHRRSVAQAWAITVNPRLGYTTPVKAIREERFNEAAAAMRALVEEAYDG